MKIKKSNLCIGNTPFSGATNYLYWDFLARNREKLQTNHRIGMMYKTYDRMDEDKKQMISDDSQRFFDEQS